MPIYRRYKRPSFVLSKLGRVFRSHTSALKIINIIEDISLDKGDVFFTVVIINLSLNFTWHLGISDLELLTSNFYFLPCISHIEYF
jgi:hypothetical protein